MAKINITMNDGLLSELDALAKKNYSTRSGMISIALANYIQQQRISDGLISVAAALQRIADTGVLTDKDREDLETFTKFIELYNNTL